MEKTVTIDGQVITIQEFMQKVENCPKGFKIVEVSQDVWKTLQILRD